MRLQIAKRTDYAIRACLHLAVEAECPISGRRIAEQMAIPEQFLPQVMADLGRAGIVGATSGKNGGYCLRRVPEALSLLDIVVAVEGADRRRAGGFEDAARQGDPACALYPVWDQAQAAFIDVLAGASIAELATRQRAAEMSNENGPTRPDGDGGQGPERTDR
jgi:Rrf2 family protein